MTDTEFIQKWREHARLHWADPTLRQTGDCACGLKMNGRDYSYSGGSHGSFDCSNCGRHYTVDINGVMWEA